MVTVRTTTTFTTTQVKSLRQRILRQISLPPSGCVLWTGAVNNHGYGVIGVGSSAVYYVHRVVWFLANGRWPIGLLHTCDTPRCVLHTIEGDQKANLADMRRKGRHAHKLTDQQRQEIRDAYAGQRYKRGGRTLSALAQDYGVHLATIHAVVTRR